MKGVNKFLKERKRRVIESRKLNLYCDKMRGWFKKEECGGQLYDKYGTLMVNRFNPHGPKFKVAQCDKCGTTYDLPPNA